MLGLGRAERGSLSRLAHPHCAYRKGTRWLLQALSPAPVIVLVHGGRNTGKIYKTPIEVMFDHRERREFVVAPMWGRRSDWYRNVVAGGLVGRIILRMLVRVNGFEGDPEQAGLRSPRSAALDDYGPCR